MQGATSDGSEAPVAYFAELEGDAGVQLAAAVVYRGIPTRAALRGGGGPFGWLRSVRHRLWLRLGPLGADVSVAGRPLFGGDAWAPRGISSVEPRLFGEPLAYYDDGSRVLRLLGRVLPAPPPGQTLVALVDATGPRAAAPRLVIRIVPAPTVAVEWPELEVEHPELGDVPTAFTRSYFVGGEHPAWLAALRADPVVRAFLDGPSR